MSERERQIIEKLNSELKGRRLSFDVSGGKQETVILGIRSKEDGSIIFDGQPFSVILFRFAGGTMAAILKDELCGGWEVDCSDLASNVKVNSIPIGHAMAVACQA